MQRRTYLKWMAAHVLGMSSFQAQSKNNAVPVLLYHRFGSTVADSMTMRTSVFEAQLDLLAARGYTVIPLAQVVKSLQENIPLPANAVAICADDGHRSVFEIMFPMVKERGLHVTAFIYPSAISNASYAMTWKQLHTLQQSGHFDMQSHTVWHPNFNHEKKKLSEQRYVEFVQMQLTKSRQRLQSEFDTPVTMLAWPFGIYNDELLKMAEQAGYTAAFTIVPKPAMAGDQLLALPRFLMTDDGGTRQLERILRS